MTTFKTRVNQRVYMLSFEDWIEKEFKRTALRRVRKIREQIARELAELEGARQAGLSER